MQFHKFQIFVIFQISDFSNFPNCKFLKLSKFQILEISQIANFSTFPNWKFFLIVRYPALLAICQFSYLPFDINQYSQFSFPILLTRKFGLSTFERPLTFKSKTSAILKFYCLKFPPSSKLKNRKFLKFYQFKTPKIGEFQNCLFIRNSALLKILPILISVLWYKSISTLQLLNFYSHLETQLKIFRKLSN